MAKYRPGSAGRPNRADYGEALRIHAPSDLFGVAVVYHWLVCRVRFVAGRVSGFRAYAYLESMAGSIRRIFSGPEVWRRSNPISKTPSAIAAENMEPLSGPPW